MVIPGVSCSVIKGAGRARRTSAVSKICSVFVPNVPRDRNLGGPPRDDFPFGPRELAPINNKRPNHVFVGIIV